MYYNDQLSFMQVLVVLPQFLTVSNICRHRLYRTDLMPHVLNPQPGNVLLPRNSPAAAVPKSVEIGVQAYLEVF